MFFHLSPPPSYLALLHATDEVDYDLLAAIEAQPSYAQYTGAQQHMTTGDTPYQAPSAYAMAAQYQPQPGASTAGYTTHHQPAQFYQEELNVSIVAHTGKPELRAGTATPRSPTPTKRQGRGDKLAQATTKKRRRTAGKSAALSLAPNLDAKPARAEWSCDGCRQAKIKCTYDEHDAPVGHLVQVQHPGNGADGGEAVKCRHCARSGLECTYGMPRTRKGRPRKMVGPVQVQLVCHRNCQVAPGRTEDLWIYERVELAPPM
ncbi:hypothetical protein OBBRIDRAFT_796024 [Obba rivulosa]|uniref:Zn(2)-C6 fungal-type domain-containing protein n=1 Tax=Obba rivulosa TaxID=1052685 RepID=A0A8E2ASN7_9APHY|nr:hypothetical protein OBBRIDRAFT_796024 [Obba rivulosa]